MQEVFCPIATNKTGVFLIKNDNLPSKTLSAEISFFLHATVQKFGSANANLTVQRSVKVDRNFYVTILGRPIL